MIPFLALTLLLSGFVIGLGAVTVIDFHAFLGRHSSYWTEATTRTHKITKPLIWIGTILAIAGGVFVFSDANVWMRMFLLTDAIILVLNGSFLSFYVSPQLLKKERAGKASELLPIPLQRWIFLSFLVSLFGWWSAFFLTVYQLSL